MPRGALYEWSAPSSRIRRGAKRPVECASGRAAHGFAASTDSLPPLSLSAPVEVCAGRRALRFGQGRIDREVKSRFNGAWEPRQGRDKGGSGRALDCGREEI